MALLIWARGSSALWQEVSVTGEDSSPYGGWDVRERQARAGISSSLQRMPSVIKLYPIQPAVLEVLPPPDRT